MYVYRNIKTGAEVRSVSPCTGENWELISEPKPMVIAAQVEKPAEVAPPAATKRRARKK